MPLPLSRKLVHVTGFRADDFRDGKMGQSGTDRWSVTAAGPSVPGYEPFARHRGMCGRPSTVFTMTIAVDRIHNQFGMHPPGGYCFSVSKYHGR